MWSTIRSINNIINCATFLKVLGHVLLYAFKICILCACPIGLYVVGCIHDYSA